MHSGTHNSYMTLIIDYRATYVYVSSSIIYALIGVHEMHGRMHPN